MSGFRNYPAPDGGEPTAGFWREFAKRGRWDLFPMLDPDPIPINNGSYCRCCRTPDARLVRPAYRGVRMCQTCDGSTVTESRKWHDEPWTGDKR